MLLIENATLYTPAPRGRATLVAAGGRIEKIGDAGDLAKHFDCEVLDASGCIVAPGLIDPHVHLIGGSGEQGFATQTPYVGVTELLASGITSVVGTLGTDTTTRTLPALIAQVKALREEGLNAWMWTGGYDGRSITRSMRDDIILLAEVIGAGELAIADRRGMYFSPRELAQLATDCYVAGTLTGKAGVLHLHVGEGRTRLQVLRDALDQFDVVAASLYPTHVNRNEELFAEAIGLTRRGVAIDLDVYEESLARWLKLYDGDRTMLTISSDAAINSPRTLLEQIVDATSVWPLEDVLALATTNTARVLKLRDAGELAEGKRADAIVLDEKTLALRHVIAGGEIVVRDGRPLRRERFLHNSNRRIHLTGDKFGGHEKA
jgi:beta-aspartyl-dipeptidase (metallo-type)